MIREKKWISDKDLFSAVFDALLDGKQVSFTVTGMSMWPFLCHGRDKVIVSSVENLKKGDIVLWQTPTGRHILHRLVYLDDIYFETAGDGNCFKDGRLPRTMIKAKVVSVVRKNKKISCDSFKWRILGSLWTMLFDWRKILLIILKKTSHIFHYVGSYVKYK